MKGVICIGEEFTEKIVALLISEGIKSGIGFCEKTPTEGFAEDRV